MALIGNCFEDRFYNFFMPLIKNLYGVSALAGNWRKECGFKANNLQNSFQKKLGHTDESYTKAVDDGSYKNFVRDGAGYGCAQWTYWSRKQGLLDYAKEKGVSIGDEEMQFEYAWKELSQGYKSVLSALKTAKSVKEASYIVLTQYERPANQGEKEQAERTLYGEEFYKKYAIKNGGSQMSKPKVCIDAGHYGKYNRCPNNPKYYESEMVWKLHLLQKKYLEKLGIDVVTTRASKDKDLDLTIRGRASEGCSLFISDHSNAVGGGMNEIIDHVAVYHLVDDKSVSCDDISKEIAEKIAPVIAEIMGVKQGYKILTRKSDNDRNNDGVMNDNYYGVLHGARVVNTPGLILEHSFHTNSKVVEWLLVDDNLDKLAKAEAECIASYLLGKKVTVPGETKPADNVMYRVQVGAYSVKANADAQLKKVKAAGFDCFMVQVGKMYKIQVGAFSVKVNADAMLAKVKAAGFDAFITTQGGQAVSTTTTAKKSIEEVAKEVLQGKWGNGAERKRRLTQSGYNYAEVQNAVKKLK